MQADTSRVRYSSNTLQRAQRALSCSPFCLILFGDMLRQSVSLSEIGGKNGLKNGYTKQKISDTLVEAELVWLIQTGLLRREVDGQGLTDSFRLTPLGRKIITNYKKEGDNFPKPTPSNRLANFTSRWLKLKI